jgi:hypothetical protein
MKFSKKKKKLVFEVKLSPPCPGYHTWTWYIRAIAFLAIHSSYTTDRGSEASC